MRQSTIDELRKTAWELSLEDLEAVQAGSNYEAYAFGNLRYLLWVSSKSSLELSLTLDSRDDEVSIKYIADEIKKNLPDHITRSTVCSRLNTPSNYGKIYIAALWYLTKVFLGSKKGNEVYSYVTFHKQEDTDHDWIRTQPTEIVAYIPNKKFRLKEFSKHCKIPGAIELLEALSIK